MNLSHVNNSTFYCTNDTVHAYVEGVAESVADLAPVKMHWLGNILA